MIEFFLGFIAGIIITDILLANRGVIEPLYDKIRPKLKINLNPKAEFLESGSEKAEAIASIIQENEEKGTDTKLSEL